MIFSRLHNLFRTYTCCVLGVCGSVGVYVVVKCIKGVLCINSLHNYCTIVRKNYTAIFPMIFSRLHNLSYTYTHTCCVLGVCGCVGVYVVTINSLNVTPQLLYKCKKELYCNLPHDIL